MLSRSLAVAVVVSSLSMACAPLAVDTFPPFPTRDPSVITLAEAEGFEGRTALDLIKRVRPAFLFSRGATSVFGTSSAMPTIFVDGMRYGPYETLNQIPAAWVAEIRMYRANNTSQFSGENMGGVLAIRTRLRN